MTKRGVDEITELLQERAKKLASRQKTQETQEGTSMLVLRIGTAFVAFASEVVVQTLPLPTVISLPALPQWLLGVAQYRTHILALLDIAQLLGNPSIDKPVVLVVLEGTSGSIGVVAHEVIGLRNIQASEIRTNPKDRDEPMAFAPFITHDLVTLIDVEQLLLDPRVSGKAEQRTRDLS